MKKILGLDLGTNSIGWSLVNLDFLQRKGNILGLGSRIIPTSQDLLVYYFFYYVIGFFHGRTIKLLK